ncbi:hypothetical protein T11_17712 [Trichinella zimbabwensis]|uniref:HTH OST-type domain-containing protein n=1 Tax=Trichinella zimbabwensis TaxID=268475 RepID=A0A0V1I6E5_9BILA|nr:hypothetical protein T11_17712 [Trichinella zimbabwensis]
MILDMSDLEWTRKKVYSVLKAFPHGATETEFISEFKTFTGYDVPFQTYGFETLTGFIASSPNLYSIRCDAKDNVLYIAKPSELSSTLDRFISKQHNNDIYKITTYCHDYVPPTKDADVTSSSCERAVSEDETDPTEGSGQLEQQSFLFILNFTLKMLHMKSLNFRQQSSISVNSVVAIVEETGPLNILNALIEMNALRPRSVDGDLNTYIQPYGVLIRFFTFFQTHFPSTILHIETPSLFSLFPKSFDHERYRMAAAIFKFVAHTDPVFMNDIHCGKLYAVMCKDLSFCSCGAHMYTRGMTYYRGLCVEILDGGQATFRLIDYGCMVTIGISFVRQLPSGFHTMIALSIDCKLDGVGIFSDDVEWSDEAINYMKTALRNNSFNVTVKQQYFAESDFGVLLPFISVVLKSVDDNLEINSDLVANGLAVAL